MNGENDNKDYYSYSNGASSAAGQVAQPAHAAGQAEAFRAQAYAESGRQEFVPPSAKAAGKPARGRFLAGMAVGMVLSALVCTVAYLLIYPRLQESADAAAAGTQTGSASSVRILDRETRDKINKLNQTIDDYYYKDDVTLDERRNAMYKALVASLGDVYSVYYTEEEYNAQMQSFQGVYYGIGAYVSLNEELSRAYISGVIPDSPAEEAGLMENDIIWTVDGTSTEGMQTDEVATMIRGPEGTEVVVGIRRGEEDLSFTLTRREVKHQTIAYRMLEGDIGYLQITEFDDVTYTQFTEAYAALESDGMRALVLDLRSNPGGNLSTVCQIANELLPEGEIVYTIDKYGERESYSADGKHEIQIPLAVLINGNSASASEILAGAVKDYEKGTLIGTTTFGKGIVQRIIGMEDGTAVKLTVSDYYTPSGNNIHGVGIAPDIEIEFDAEAYQKDGTDNQLDRATEFLKKELR